MVVSLKNTTVRYNSTKMLYIQHFGVVILPIIVLFDSEYKISLPLIETEKLASNAIKLSISELALGNPALALSKSLIQLNDV